MVIVKFGKIYFCGVLLLAATILCGCSSLARQNDTAPLPAIPEPERNVEAFEARIKALKGTPAKEFKPRFAAAMQTARGPELLGADRNADGEIILSYHWINPARNYECGIQIRVSADIVQSYSYAGPGCINTVSEFEVPEPEGLDGRAGYKSYSTNDPEDKKRSKKNMEKEIKEFIGVSDRYLATTVSERFKLAAITKDIRCLANGDKNTKVILPSTYNRRSGKPSVVNILVEKDASNKKFYHSYEIFNIVKQHLLCNIEFISRNGIISGYSLDGDGCIW